MSRRMPVFVDGKWRESEGTSSFDAIDPRTGQVLGTCPVSPWSELDEALEAGDAAYRSTQAAGPEAIADFLDRYARRIESSASQLVATAHAETALPARPRLAEVELPRTIDQIRQAANAASKRSWRFPVISPNVGVASMYGPLPGPACIFGPNNFPFAFNSASGGDAVAALATGHPIIAKANPGHPGTTQIFAQEAAIAAEQAGLAPSMVQLVYRTSHEDGTRLVSDPRVSATAYTGSRRGGLVLKDAADRAGKPIYLELSSLNPVVILAGAWRERGEALADELVGSILLGVGQFCTQPGLLLMNRGDHADGLREAIAARLRAAPIGTLLAEGVAEGLSHSIEVMTQAGARVVASGGTGGEGCHFPNTLLEVEGVAFLKESEKLQIEAFGNVSMMVVCKDEDELAACVQNLEGNLTGSFYTATDGSDDASYERLVPMLRERVGRLLNDKVPTGVVVCAAMNHGGPYPATGHPMFTAVGIPASLVRFCTLQCYDNVRDNRLPLELQASNPLHLQRYVWGQWTTDPITWAEGRDRNSPK